MGVVLAIAAACAAASGLGCGSAQPAPPSGALLRVVTEPPSASVYVDDRFASTGRAMAVRPRQFRPGVHYITVQAPRHFPHDVELDLPPGLTTVRVSLRPVPP